MTGQQATVCIPWGCICMADSWSVLVQSARPNSCGSTGCITINKLPQRVGKPYITRFSGERTSAPGRLDALPYGCLMPCMHSPSARRPQPSFTSLTTLLQTRVLRCIGLFATHAQGSRRQWLSFVMCCRGEGVNHHVSTRISLQAIARGRPTCVPGSLKPDWSTPRTRQPTDSRQVMRTHSYVLKTWDVKCECE